jgi:predicted nucleotidyltransferase
VGKTILQYQKVYNKVTERFKLNKNVLAVMVFGSMVSGDLWEESDIDLFVIINDELDDIRNIYVTENSVPVHIKLLSKEKLFFHNHNSQDGFLHRVFAGSRLVFSKDAEITLRYDNGRYYSDMDKNRWDLFYLSNFIKLSSVCKKYLSKGSIYTAYSFMLKCAEEYSKLFVNSSGYMINNNVISMAANASEDFKAHLDKIIFEKENLEESIKNIISYMEKNVESNMKKFTSFLLRFMTEKDCFLSAEDIKNDDMFKNFKINFEDILIKLTQLNLIKKENTDYKTKDGTNLIRENVYYI